jgi:hypothetical protein
MDPARFVFLDETGVTTKMTRLYGRAQRGERLVDAVPHGHWRTTTLIAGLRQSGVIAPMVLDGPMTGAAFLADACPGEGRGRAGPRTRSPIG